MLVGLKTAAAAPDTMLILDAIEGQLIVAPDQKTVVEYRLRMETEEKQAKV